VGAGNSSLHHRIQNGSGAHPPPLQWIPGALSLGVKRPGREVDHLPSSSAEVKNAWSYNSTPQYAFMAWCLVKYRGNFTFTFTFYFYRPIMAAEPLHSVGKKRYYRNIKAHFESRSCFTTQELPLKREKETFFTFLHSLIFCLQTLVICVTNNFECTVKIFFSDVLFPTDKLHIPYLRFTGDDDSNHSLLGCDTV
jgi:hypothetical protein